MRKVRVQVAFVVMAQGHDDSRSRRCWEQVLVRRQMDMLRWGVRETLRCLNLRCYLPSLKKTSSVLHSLGIVLTVGGCIRFRVDACALRDVVVIDEVSGGSGG